MYGHGITFVDIDETIFHTFAKVKVIRGHEVVRVLDNQQFNTDVLGPGEQYDFGQFRNAELFRRTSKPIQPVVDRINKMIRQIQEYAHGSRVTFLTARADFDDKNIFLDTFRSYGIKVDDRDVYIERAGNLKEGTVAERKKRIVMQYLGAGEFRRVRLIDDDRKNLEDFLTIRHEIPPEILGRIRHRHGIQQLPDDEVIDYYALHVQPDGKLEQLEL